MDNFPFGCPAFGCPEDCHITSTCSHHEDCAESARDSEKAMGEEDEREVNPVAFKTTPEQREFIAEYVRTGKLPKGFDPAEFDEDFFIPAYIDDFETAIATIKKLAPYKGDVDGLERKIISLEQERDSLRAQLKESQGQAKALAGHLPKVVGELWKREGATPSGFCLWTADEWLEHTKTGELVLLKEPSCS